MDTKVEDALEYIDPNIPRDDWVRVGMALKSEYGDSGFAVFDEWSQGGETYDKANIRSTWRSITPNGNTRIGTLYYMAREHGYKPFRVMSEDEKTRIAEERKRNAERIQQEYLKAEAEKRKTQERVDSATLESNSCCPPAFQISTRLPCRLLLWEISSQRR